MIGFVIDEIGKLELKGQGLEPAASMAIQKALSQSLNLIIVVRDYLLNEAITHYNLQEAHVIDVNELNEI